MPEKLEEVWPPASEAPWTNEQLDECTCMDLFVDEPGLTVNAASECAKETCPGVEAFARCVAEGELACRNQCDDERAALDCCVEQSGCADDDTDCIYEERCIDPGVEKENCALVLDDTRFDCFEFAVDYCAD